LHGHEKQQEQEQERPDPCMSIKHIFLASQNSAAAYCGSYEDYAVGAWVCQDFSDKSAQF
jgi:hypothetical protein